MKQNHSMTQSGAPDAAGASAAGAALKAPGQAQAGRNSAAGQARLVSSPATEVLCQSALWRCVLPHASSALHASGCAPLA